MCLALIALVASTADATGLLKKLKKKHFEKHFGKHFGKDFGKHGLKFLGGGGLGGGVFPFVGLNFGGAPKENVQETFREVEVVHEKPVVHTVVKEVPVNIIREEPFERIVHVNRPVEVSYKSTTFVKVSNLFCFTGCQNNPS